MVAITSWLRICISVMFLCAAGAAFAEECSKPFEVDLPRMQAWLALRMLDKQGGCGVNYAIMRPELVSETTMLGPLQGRYTFVQALTLLVEGSPWVAVQLSNGLYALMPRQTMEELHPLAAPKRRSEASPVTDTHGAQLR